MTGIIIALRWIEEVKPLRTVICTDSMAALHSLDTGHLSREELVIEIRHLLLQIRNLGIIIQFCWVPAHMGIKVNEEADKIAKKHILENKYLGINVPMGKREANSIIKSVIIQNWQREREE